MIDVKNDEPMKEDVSSRLDFLMAEIRDITLEVERTAKEISNRRYLITREKACEILCCENVPKIIPKVRVGNQWRYEIKDIEDFIESKKFRR